MYNISMAKEHLQVAAKAVIVHKGKILILREPAKNNLGTEHGRYGNPGGRLDAGENYDEALRREVKEECGLEIEPLYPIFVGEWYPLINGIKTHVIAIFTVCKAKTTKVKLSAEHDDYKWIRPEEVNEYDIMDPEPEVIKRYAKRQENR